MSKVLHTTRADGVAIVTLNNVDKHNAFDDQVIADLTDLFQAIDGDPSVRCLVLAANGKFFSAGGDLNWMRRMTDYSYQQNLDDARALAHMLKTLDQLSKPTIARVQGPAYGGAVGLVSCCDMAVATNRASFCLSEVKVGLIPATISPYVMAAIGARASRRYFTTAETFDASIAHHLGLLSSVVAENDLDDEVERLVQCLMHNSPAAIRHAKRLIFDFARREISDELIEDSCRRIAEIRVSEQGQEGLNAFIEKRKPAWQQPED